MHTGRGYSDVMGYIGDTVKSRKMRYTVAVNQAMNIDVCPL